MQSEICTKCAFSLKKGKKDGIPANNIPNPKDKAMAIDGSPGKTVFINLTIIGVVLCNNATPKHNAMALLPKKPNSKADNGKEICSQRLQPKASEIKPPIILPVKAENPVANNKV